MARITNAKVGRLLQQPTRQAVPRKGPVVLGRVIRYLREVRTELSRVDWPSRKELIGSTLIVVIVLILLALYLGFWDLLFTEGVKRWLIRPPASP